MFDNDFTELFDSKKFGDNYGKLVASELELSKHWEQIVNVMLQSANLPNKKEIDEVYKELHSLRKRVSKLESQLKTTKPRSETDDSGK
jgi:polyhydroxyalkanoate synthesis regulator phasin